MVASTPAADQLGQGVLIVPTDRADPDLYLHIDVGTIGLPARRPNRANLPPVGRSSDILVTATMNGASAAVFPYRRAGPLALWGRLCPELCPELAVRTEVAPWSGQRYRPAAHSLDLQEKCAFQQGNLPMEGPDRTDETVVAARTEAVDRERARPAVAEGRDGVRR